MTEMVLANARVVTADEVFAGSVHVTDGRIAAIDTGAGLPRGAENLEGDFLWPGLVELHTDVLERHAAPRPGVRWPAAAAVVAHDAQLAVSGITTVLDGLAVGVLVDAGQRPADPRPMAEAIRAAQVAGRLRVEHLFHMRCEVATAEVIRHFEPFAGDPLVRLVSLMDHTPGQRQYVSLDKYRAYYQGKYGFTAAEMERFIADRLEAQRRHGATHRAAIVALCHAHGLPLASHDDATVAHVEDAVKTGAAVAEFPTTVEAAQTARAYGLAVLAGAPNLVCGGSHSGNVAAATLAEADLIDVLSSDYVPASLLHGAWLLHAAHGRPLPAAVRAVSTEPARRVGLDDRGEIEPGQRADLLRVRVDEGLPVLRAAWRRGRRIA
jgi:alpha-D-ribose 1-methylphosphonate 5-triphosphate diphosphatase